MKASARAILANSARPKPLSLCAPEALAYKPSSAGNFGNVVSFPPVAAGAPLAQQLEREYAMRFRGAATYRAGVWKILTSAFFSRWIARDSSLLDLGCGWCEFINAIEAGQKFAMDLNPATRQKLHSGINLLAQDCSMPWQLQDAQLDVIFTSNFFEHLASKESLRRTFDEAFRCLKPGGRLICLGPNIKFVRGRYWDFWDHSLPLTDQSLKEGLELAGFATEFVIPRFLPYSMSQGWNPPLFFLRLYLKFPFLWRIAGKQFLIIAAKPAL